MNSLCIDFGGTKTLVAALNNKGEIISKERFETPEQYPDFINILADTINELPDKFEKGVMSVPGLIDQTSGTVIALGNRPWTNISLEQDVQSKTNVSLSLLNDTRLAGLAEGRHLNGRYRRVLYITISTGIGIALTVNGELVEALNDTEFGKMPIEVNGTMIPWEEVASGRVIAERYGRRASDIHNPNIWKEISHTFLLGVAPACAAFQPDAIVFGGGVGEQTEKFADFLMEKLIPTLHPVIKRPQALLPSHYGGDNVLYGCYEFSKV